MARNIDFSKKTLSSNQSTEKALTILELIVRSPSPMRLSEIASALGTNNSTTYRFLSSLQNCGYIYKDPVTMKYGPTFKICRMAKEIGSNMDILRIADVYLRKLSRELGEVTCLGIERSHMVVYIETVDNDSHLVRGMQRIGNIAPLYCTGIGKLFLSEYSEQEIDKLIAEQGLRKITSYTITDKEVLMEQLRKVRSEGYACDKEECEIGFCCLAYPIRDLSGRIVAGISVTGPSSRLDHEYMENAKPIMRKTALAISRGIGWGGDKE